MQIDALANSISHLNSGVSQIKKFVIDNNIVGTSAGVGIGLAAKDAIQSLVNDVLLPSIVTFLRYLKIESLTSFLPVSKKADISIISFIKQMITFLLVVTVSFIFVKLAFDYLLGINTTKKDDKPKNGNNYNTIKDNTIKDNIKDNFEMLSHFKTSRI
jgi:large-conductance mechanosensitive channel